MSDFNIFSQALEEYYQEKKEKKEEKESCSHEETYEEHGVVTCADCGEEIERKIVNKKEWKYYGPSDTKRVLNMAQPIDQGIYNDIKELPFEEDIKEKAVEYYRLLTEKMVCGERKKFTKRGKSRTSIIFACVFNACKELGQPINIEKLILIFGLPKKKALKGLKYFVLNFPKDMDTKKIYITPINLIDDIMDQFSATSQDKREIKNLYDKIHNKSSQLNRSKPQSVAAGLIFYWLCVKNIQITINEFTKRVNLSSLTITKISKEIARILSDEGKVEKVEKNHQNKP